jgi:Spy/CpxP family protein refolding chaperone
MSPFFRPGRTRLVGFALIAVVFLVGSMTGAAMDRVISTRTAVREAATQKEPRGHIIDQVEMTGEQRARIDAILERRSERMSATWAEISPRLEAITDSARVEIMGVLTPEQRAEYERRLDERARERERQRQERDDAG